MGRFLVQIAETRNFVIEVNAESDAEARTAAWREWHDAPEVGGYEIPDTETDIVAVTAKEVA